MRSFHAKLQKMFSSVWSYGFVVPMDIVTQLSSPTHKRVVCTINDELSFHCAFMSSGVGEYFISLNKENRKKLQLAIGTEFEVSLVKDESKYGMLMPVELEELLLTPHL